MDLNESDCGYEIYSPAEFFTEFNKLKMKYRKKVNLLCGVEFSKPHLCKDKLSELSKLPYDFIIGSVNCWYKNMSLSSMIKDNISVELCYENYWKEVYNAVRAGGFDCLGHFDFPKLSYGKVIVDNNIVPDIFRTMINKNISLEINTSSLRNKMSESMPDKEILWLYKACGGAYVTIGSDAHIAGELAADYKYAKDLIRYFGFEEVCYIQRKRRRIRPF